MLILSTLPEFQVIINIFNHNRLSQSIRLLDPGAATFADKNMKKWFNSFLAVFKC